VLSARVLGPATAVVAFIVLAACHAESPSSPGLTERIDRAARTCAKVASCAHPHDAPRDRDPSACVDAWVARAAADVNPFEACVAAAPGCEQVDACMRARGDAVATAYCRANHASAGARSGCDGNRLVECSEDDPAESSSTDCAAFGATCGDVPQTGGLMTRACVSATLCPPGAPEVRCQGEHVILGCRDGAVDRTACLGNARCEEHSVAGAPSAICEPPAHRHCDAVGKKWCEGGKLVSCQPHGPFGEAVVSDCAALGLACDEHAVTGAACVAPGPRGCDHAAARCDGDALTFCAAGRRFRVACADLGFAACDPDAHGVDAACAASAPARPAR
jgi:hypothetical protein